MFWSKILFLPRVISGRVRQALLKDASDIGLVCKSKNYYLYIQHAGHL